MKRLSIVLVALVLALLGAATAGPASAAGDPSAGYVPFVTDFPKPVKAQSFARESGADWADVGLASGVGVALAALLAGSALALARRARPARS